MGKFDAAVKVLLREELKFINPPMSIRNAIRVLEAASKVDERDLGRVFMGFVSAEMRELLEAIKAAKENE